MTNDEARMTNGCTSAPVRHSGFVSAHVGRNVMPDALRTAEARLGRRVEFEELLPAADTIIVTARGPVATLPIAISMAAALPIAATVTPTVAELLEDRHTALMTAPGKPRVFARRALDLLEDPSAQWTLSDMARTEAYEYFAFTRFVNQVRSVYRQIVESDKVEVHQPAPGAGMRFHGRG
jgi:glycosyltransferase involved in cell wall biosynthesis